MDVEDLFAEGSAARQQQSSGQQLPRQGQLLHASSAPYGGLTEGPARLPTFSFSFAPLQADAAQAQRAVRHERLPPLLVLPGNEVGAKVPTLQKALQASCMAARSSLTGPHYLCFLFMPY